jgi:hypothetical protein
MPFVVKAVGLTDGALWLTANGALSKRREDAQTFTNRIDAQGALIAVVRDELPPEVRPAAFQIVEA